MRHVNFIISVTVLALIIAVNSHAQDKSKVWNNHKCAVVLTYDDGLDGHLDNVIPVLDSAGFKGTFYIPGNSPVLFERMEEWKIAASNGHELGNHTIFHPCLGKSKGRDWVQPDYDMDNYSISRVLDEIRIANTLLKAVDGKENRTFAYTCGDYIIGSVSFKDSIKNDFVSARGVVSKMEKIGETDLFDIGSFMINGESGQDLIKLVNRAMENGALLVFLFHGVGGGHNINVSSEAHNELIKYLKENEKNIWVAPFITISSYLREYEMD